MVIRRIKLVNFRNHTLFSLDFDVNTVKIIGENGCGKTSILEAIYEVMQGKSFRAVDREILKRGEDFYRVELEYVDGREVVVIYDGVKKEFLVEDKKVRRLPKKNKYPIVLFEPDDLRLMSSSPVTRRNYFDRFFAQLSDTYSLALGRYNKALKQRNELLKRDDVTATDVFSWNMLLVRYGVELMEIRKDYVGQISEKITEVYRSIADNDDEISLEYLTEVGSEGGFLAEIEKGFDKDRYVGHTGVGVHHDDYLFKFNQQKADGSASRGEIRSVIIALKFIEAEMVVEKIRKIPVVLLDDVFSELDEIRQKCLVKNFQNNQIVLTSVADRGDMGKRISLKQD